MLTLIAYLLSMSLVLSLILGWSLFAGWILTLILPFDLFEGTLLALLASAFGAYALAHPPGDSSVPDWDDWDDWDDDEEPEEISLRKFVKSESDKTWENLVRYEIANAVMREFNDTPKISTIAETQREALAIRMSDAAVAFLKRKSPRSTSFSMTMNQLRNQLQRMDFKPDDDDILDAAVIGINIALYDVPIARVVQQRLWNQSTPMMIDLDDDTDDTDDTATTGVL